MAGHRATIIATVLVGVLGAAATLYTHFSGNDNDVKGTVSGASSSDNEVKSTPSISLTDVFVTPIDTKIASTFYTEINNKGTANAENFTVTLDFGEASTEECELVPSSSGTFNEPEKGSIQTITIKSLLKKQSIYVVCSLNAPFFKKVHVGGGNIEHEKSLTYESYKALDSGESIGFYAGLWRAIVIFFAIAIGLKIIGFLFD